MPKVAIIIVSYNHAKFLPACFKHLAKVDYPCEALKIFLVDNGNDETTEIVERDFMDKDKGVTKIGNIRTKIIKPKENTGFTGGNNIAIKVAMEEGFEYVYLLNPDTEVYPEFLKEALRVAESDPTIGAVQSLMILAQDPKLINSWGNEVHYLGFSFAGGYRVSLDSHNAEEKVILRDIPTASGAAVMFRLAALKVVGLFDNAIFAYHEDVDLSLRLRLAGFRVVLAPESVLRHRYEFSRSITKFYFMERNRYWVQVKILRLPTLLLILPAWIFMEFGLWFYALIGGWWKEKARACVYLLSPKNLVILFRERQNVQKTRVLPDRELVKFFASKILYQEIAHPLWEYFGNHLFALYWFIIKRVIWW